MPKRGRRRKKTRTHVVPVEDAIGTIPVPRTLVVKRGRVGHAVESLVTDLRTVLQPNTAMKLKERKRGTLKDYVSVAGPLGITHMLMLSKTDTNVNLRIGRVPRGPTLTFKVESYVLGSDVRSYQRRPCDFAQALRTSPLVVLNNFGGENRPNHLKLVATTFQNIFPTINVQTVRLSDCQRVVLLNYNEKDDTVEFRHYFIRPTATGVNRSVKRIAAQSRIPDLSHLENIAEYVLGNEIYGPGGGGAGSGSDSEFEDESSKVTLSQDLRTRGAKVGAQSAIRLAEIGPRMVLKLAKVESGLADGDVLYHAFVNKTQEESKSLKRKHEEKAEKKAERKREQEENVELKKQKLAEKKEKKMGRRKARKAVLAASDAKQAAAAAAGGGGGGGGVEGDEEEESEGMASSEDEGN